MNFKDKLKIEGVSIFITFLSVFLGFISLSLQTTGVVVWDSSAILALLAAGLRAGVKAVIEKGSLSLVGAPSKK